MIFPRSHWRKFQNSVQMIIHKAQQVNSPADQVRSTVKEPLNSFGYKPDQNPSGRLAWDNLRIHAIQRLLIKPIYLRARQFRLYREAVSATYSYSYGIFRLFFMELGKRLSAQGSFEHPEDIFFCAGTRLGQSFKEIIFPSKPDRFSARRNHCPAKNRAFQQSGYYAARNNLWR